MIKSSRRYFGSSSGNKCNTHLTFAKFRQTKLLDTMWVFNVNINTISNILIVKNIMVFKIFRDFQNRLHLSIKTRMNTKCRLTNSISPSNRFLKSSYHCYQLNGSTFYYFFWRATQKRSTSDEIKRSNKFSLHHFIQGTEFFLLLTHSACVLLSPSFTHKTVIAVHRRQSFG